MIFKKNLPLWETPLIPDANIDKLLPYNMVDSTLKDHIDKAWKHPEYLLIYTILKFLERLPVYHKFNNLRGLCSLYIDFRGILYFMGASDFCSSSIIINTYHNIFIMEGYSKKFFNYHGLYFWPLYRKKFGFIPNYNSSIKPRIQFTQYILSKFKFPDDAKYSIAYVSSWLVNYVYENNTFETKFITFK